MGKNDFEIVEEDGIVIYDQSDDYDPGEDEDIKTEDGFILPDNEEIFTDEYMQDFAQKMDAKIAREKRTQRLVSICVVIGIIAYILMMIWLIT